MFGNSYIEHVTSISMYKDVIYFKVIKKDKIMLDSIIQYQFLIPFGTWISNHTKKN